MERSPIVKIVRETSDRKASEAKASIDTIPTRDGTTLENVPRVTGGRVLRKKFVAATRCCRDSAFSNETNAGGRNTSGKYRKSRVLRFSTRAGIIRRVLYMKIHAEQPARPCLLYYPRQIPRDNKTPCGSLARRECQQLS